jgi:hypothetical protein
MAHFSESLCEEVIKTDGRCGLTRNEMVQMARFALRAIRNENPWKLDGIRYRWLKREEEHVGSEPFICRRQGSTFTRWTGQEADAAVNEAMSGGDNPQSAAVDGNSTKEEQ